VSPRPWLWLPLAALPCAAGAQAPELADHLPGAVPDVSAWPSSGEVLDLDDPPRTLEYVLYVDPERQGEWALVRYRVRVEDPAARERLGVDDDEKLQWSVDGRRLRRFACRAAASGCAWEELEPGTPAYDRELGTVLFIYRTHRQLLRARARSLLPPPD